MKKFAANVALIALGLVCLPALAQTSAGPAAEAKKPSADAKPAAEPKAAEPKAAEAKAAPAAKPKRARAAPGAVVEALEMPAWVERQGEGRLPLTPGMVLKSLDQVHTGAGARVLLRTADGSSVKLGGNAALVIEAMQTTKERVFQAALKVAEGAFRFTTETFAKFRGKREVSVTFATVTAGIRGTDLWGKSSPDKQIVCLIEGKVEVTAPGEAALSMDQPMQFYVREKDKSQPVAPVPAEQLKIWAAETETQPGEGVARRGGKWHVTAVTSASANEALKVYEALRAAGYAAELRPAKVDNKRVYGVRLSQFASKKDTEAVVTGLKQRSGLGEYDYKIGS